MIQRAFKYKLTPNTKQAERFAQHFGAARFIYNTALDMKRRHYEREGKGLTKREVQDQFVALKGTPEFAWLYDINSQSILATLEHVHRAYQNFFRGNARFPRFKSRKSYWRSYQCPQHVRVDFHEQRVHLPKIGWVKARLHREFDGKIKTCTIKRAPSGDYSISILVEIDSKLPPKPSIEETTTRGIDLGLANFYTDCCGDKVASPKPLNQSLERLAVLQKRFARLKKGSALREAQRLRIARLHQRITNQRNDFLHKQAYRLLSDNQAETIAMEDLNVEGMGRNSKLARHIKDVAWGRFTQFLTYKSDWFGKNLIQCGRFDPSSRQCNCGAINNTLTLADRSWICQACGETHDRDVLAARNIKSMALSKYQSGQVSPAA